MFMLTGIQWLMKLIKLRFALAVSATADRL